MNSSYFGKDFYVCESDTSNEDAKYRKDFFEGLDYKARNDHILSLWKKCYLRASTMTNILKSYKLLKTKIEIFGRQMISDKAFRDHNIRIQ